MGVAGAMACPRSGFGDGKSDAAGLPADASRVAATVCGDRPAARRENAAGVTRRASRTGGHPRPDLTGGGRSEAAGAADREVHIGHGWSGLL